MDEYTINVVYENTKEELKTFAHTVEGAIDNMVLLDGVSYLYSIKNVKTGESWEFNEDLVPLRELRNKIPTNVDMFFAVKHDKTH